MILLALETSSARASLALLRDGEIAGETAWMTPASRHLRLFDELGPFLARHGLSVRDVGAIAAGRGPGAFAGIRMAIAAIDAFALPTGCRVFAVNSAQALALGVADAHGDPAVAVVGDARRGRLWCGIFRRAGAWMVPEGDLRLVPADELAAAVPPDARPVTSDWPRLAPLLPPAAAADPRWIRESVHPDAKEIARLAAAQFAGLLPAEPVEPLYLHPPV
jgi:tRNA threonylcarbamoyladenosine biosynthesis protein TsaB